MAKARYGFTIVTIGFFLLTLAGHWVFAWFAYVDEQQAHNETIDMRGYAIETTRDTLENWQSEFLQLVWQVAGLALLLHIGSPQSKEGDDRKEEKIDLLLAHAYGEGRARELQKRLEAKYPKG